MPREILNDRVPLPATSGKDTDTAALTDALVNVAKRLADVGEHFQAGHITDLRKSLDQAELRVVVFGEFSRGKSTLINALLGRIVLPARLIPTTGHVTQISHGARDEVRVRMVNGRTETCDLNRLDSFSSLNHANTARDDVDLIEVIVNCPSLRDGLVLVDTPGVNEKAAQTRRTTLAIAKADLVLMVLDAQQLLTIGERGLAVDWLSKELGKPVVLVVNFMNRLAESDQRDARRRLEMWCKAELRSELGRPWYEANAMAALKHALGLGPPSADHFESLRSALVDCSGQTRRNLQRQSRRGQILAELRQLRQQNRNVLDRIRAGAAAEEEKRSAMRHDLGELARRFDANAAAQRERLGLLAYNALAENLGQLVNNWFKGEPKSKLESKASIWYQKKLTEAIRKIEKEADGTLMSLAGENLRRPASFTILERMTLKARLDVGGLAAEVAEIGGKIGKFLLPNAGGEEVGRRIGTWLGDVFDRKDYVAAYSDQARVKWESDTRDVLNILQGQIDSRLTNLKSELHDRLKSAQARPMSLELLQRENLEAGLIQCERVLSSH